MMIWDVWHTQLRLVHEHFPAQQLRATRTTANGTGVAGIFVYVTPTVQNSRVMCPPNVVREFKDKNYTIIHIREPSDGRE